MASSSSGSVVVVTISRSCAKELLVALTLALGGSPVQDINAKKGKGKGKGGGKATDGKEGGKATVGKAAGKSGGSSTIIGQVIGKSKRTISKVGKSLKK